ncbi:hypothetical protein DMZ73_26000 [Salmonella enterica subsp. enterica serovar Inganda]|nr:hypothetical protein [Salmonella enterica subsp. enterica serovar Inganda]
MHPVLGTMMPEICEAPHQSLIHLCALLSTGWDAFISFLQNLIYPGHSSQQKIVGLFSTDLPSHSHRR